MRDERLNNCLILFIHKKKSPMNLIQYLLQKNS